MGMDEMVVSQINLRIDDVHNRQDNADALIEKIREENADFNSKIVAAMNDQAVAFSDIKTKQTIYVSIAVFVITLALNFGLDAVKSFSEPEKKKYYNERVEQSDAAKRLQNEVNILTEKLNEVLLAKHKG